MIRHTSRRQIRSGALGRNGRRLVSTVLASVLMFTSTTPYTTFASEEGVAPVVLAGAGAETEDPSMIEDGSAAAGQSGAGDISDIVTDQAADESAAGSANTSADAAAADGILFEDAEDGAAASTGDASADTDPGIAAPYLDEDTRDIYFVNRNSYETLQVWNENTSGSAAGLWVQHVEEADNEHPYTLYGSDQASASSMSADSAASSAAADSAASDAILASDASDTSYRFEEIKMTDTGLKDSKGGEIYSAAIPESWDYVTFAYFADDPDLKENTAIDEEGYPTDVATNGRHRTMVIKVSDSDSYLVGVPLTAEEASAVGLAGGDMIWKALQLRKEGVQAFYVNAEHFEDANGSIYRKPMLERIDGGETAATETTAQTETAAESETTAQTEAAAQTETASQTETTAQTEITSQTETTVQTEAAAESETASESETAAESEKADSEETESETEVETESEAMTETEVTSETEAETEPETENVEETEAVMPIRRMAVRKAPAATQVGNYIFLDLSNMNANNSNPNWKNANNIYLYNYTKALNKSNQSDYFHQYSGKEDNLVWWDVSSTSDYSSDDQFFFSISNDWNTLNNTNNKYYRTTLLGKIGDCKGMILTWDGHDYIDSNLTYYGYFSKTPYTTGLTLYAGEATLNLTNTESVTVPQALTAGNSLSLALDPGYDYQGYTYTWSTPKDSAGEVYAGLTMSANSGTGVVVYAAKTAASGTAKITLTAANGTTTITKTITLSIAAKSTVLTIAADQELILVGDSTTLRATADPEYSSNDVEYTWTITEGTDVLKLAAEDPYQVTENTTASAKEVSSLLQDDQEEMPSSLISEDSTDGQENASVAGLEVEESTRTQSADTPKAAPATASPLTPSTPEVQVTGLKTGTATVTVSAVDNADSTKTVTSAPVTIKVASAVLDPTEISLDLTGDNQASEDLNLQVGSGVQYDSITWSMAMNDQADPNDPTTAYSDAEKTAFENNVTLTPSDQTGKALSATVTAVQNNDLPADGRATVTVTLKNGETVVQTLTAAVAVSSNPASEGSIYYDATFSRVNQAGDNLSNNAIPYQANADSTTNGDLWVAFYDENGYKKDITAPSVNGQYTVDSGCVKILGTTLKTVTVNGHTYKYTYEIPLSLKPSDATKVQFAATKDALGKDSAQATIKATIPTDIKGACFYADGGDFKVYWGTHKNRFGYWDKAYTVRDPEKERTQNKDKTTTSGSTKYIDGNEGAPDYSTSLDNAGTSINNGISGGKSGDDVYWANSTFYDYYSDVELSGLNRSTNLTWDDNITSGSSRCYATFRQFDQALSDYYKENNTAYPMYTGHFQPSITGWGNPYTDISASLGLYGSDNNNTNTFFAVNNSTKDKNGVGDNNNRKYDMAAQGLYPYSSMFFNSSFLSGNNSKNAILGKVYNDVSFPFTRYDRDNNGIYYYHFDSAETTLHMENGYLKDTGNADWSKNTDASGHVGSDGVSNTYGFFPLNSTSVSGPSAMQYNYGFGCKLEVPFSIKEDGNLTDRDGNKVPQAFTFSGDDDVWVFIDGQLALDLGGDHGRVSGCINFSKDMAYSYNYNTKSSGTTYTQSVPAQSSFVSAVKVSPGSTQEYGIGTGKTESLQSLISGLGTGMHTLTLYYMERGQWESNIKVEFNFTPRKVLTVKKQFMENGNDITDTITSSRAKVYAMVTRHSSKNTSTEEVYPVNASGTDTISKYCIELNNDNKWKATVTELPKYVNGTDKTGGEWDYTVREVLIDDKGIPYTNRTTDAAGIAYPKAAEEGNLVKVDGTTYKVQNGTIDASGTTTLVNTRVVSTSIKVNKAFSGTDASTLPKQIRIRLERTVIAAKKDSNKNFIKDSNGNYTYDIPETIPSDATWTPVTDLGEVDADGWYTWTPKSGETNTWTHTFEGLKVNPYNDASKGVYVYRVVEASSASGAAAAAADGGTTKYDSKVGTSNSYWVHYEGASNGGAKNWVSAITDKKDKNKNYTGATVSMTNQLIVHLPSTGSRSRLVLDMMALTCLICLAAAGSFGLKKRAV